MRRKISAVGAAVAVLSLSLASCGKKKEVVEQIRSIKTMRISSKASGQTRKFSGVVFAVNYSFLSFEDVEGRIVALNVDIGDPVKKGQVLAVLDKRKYELDVKNAQAKLKKAEASLVKAKADYEREKLLFKKGVSFQQRLDTRKFQYKAAQSEESSAKSTLAMARRNLEHTELRSPFDGFVGRRFVQPNQEVRKGEKIFRIDEKGPMEIQFGIPESLCKRFALKTAGTAVFPGQAGKKVKCEISFLGSAATQGNAFPAKALILNHPEWVKPGMSAEVSFKLPVEGPDKGFLVPPEAILMGGKPRTGYVFVYDPATSTVRKRLVRFAGSQGNLGIVKDGLKDGDVIAIAGVSFLLDGMKVKLYKPAKAEGE